MTGKNLNYVWYDKNNIFSLNTMTLLEITSYISRFVYQQDIENVTLFESEVKVELYAFENW